MEKKGIDISSHQGVINFDKVKHEVDFVLIRSGYGFYHEDTMMRNYADACEKNKIPYGFYHYSYAVNVEEAKSEVAGMLDSVKNYNPTYPLIIDMEDADGYKASHGNPSNAVYIDICHTFCKALEDAGYYAMIYANRNWFETKINTSKLDKFDKWLAEWSKAPTYKKNFGIWQYTSTGKVSGIQGPVDQNIAYLDYPTLIESRGLNRLGDRKDPPADSNVDEKSVQYTVQKGDTLSSIAQKFYGDANAYQQIVTYNHLKDANRIYTNQVLTIPAASTANVQTYVVKKGDSLSSIASRFGKNWKTLYQNNKSVIGGNPNLIRPGQILKI